MKTILLNTQTTSPSRKSWLNFSKVQKITLFTIALSSIVMLLGYFVLGSITLCSGIVLQLCQKFYRENISTALAICRFEEDNLNIIEELGMN